MGLPLIRPTICSSRPHAAVLIMPSDDYAILTERFESLELSQVFLLCYSSAYAVYSTASCQTQAPESSQTAICQAEMYLRAEA